jgi:hypothetical protein
LNVELDKNELATVLDGLAALPLARSYNLFNRLAPMMQQPEQPMIPTPLPGEEAKS